MVTREELAGQGLDWLLQASLFLYLTGEEQELVLPESAIYDFHRGREIADEAERIATGEMERLRAAWESDRSVHFGRVG